MGTYVVHTFTTVCMRSALIVKGGGRAAASIKSREENEFGPSSSNKGRKCVCLKIEPFALVENIWAPRNRKVRAAKKTDIRTC